MFAAGLIVLSLAAPGPCVSAGPRCYLLLFGGQAKVGQPNTAHTWATFVCQKSEADPLEHFTISWLPVEMPVRPMSRAKPGRNYGLHETMELYRTGREKVGLWGPYEIVPSFYEDARRHKELLDSGAVSYCVFDGGPILRRQPLPRPDQSHCVHAITRCNESLRVASNPILWYGALITRRVAHHVKECGFFIHPDVSHDWLLDALELRNYSVERRTTP